MITEGETISVKWFLPTFTQHHAPGIPQIGVGNAGDANFALLKLLFAEKWNISFILKNPRILPRSFSLSLSLEKASYNIYKKLFELLTELNGKVISNKIIIQL